MYEIDNLPGCIEIGNQDEKGAGIVGDITMQAKVSNARTFDLLLKNAGNWHALLGNG